MAGEGGRVGDRSSESRDLKVLIFHHYRSPNTPETCYNFPDTIRYQIDAVFHILFLIYFFMRVNI